MKVRLLPDKAKFYGSKEFRWPKLYYLTPKKHTGLQLIFLFLICLGTSAFAYGTRWVTEDIQLSEALNKLSQKYEVFFSYDEKMIEDVEVSYNPEHYRSIEHALNELLAGTSLRYKIFDNRYIILYEESKEALTSLKGMVRHLESVIDSQEKSVKVRATQKPVALLQRSFAQQIEPFAFNVSGTVTDQDGEPLIGVNIQVKGTNTGTSSNFEGNFTLEDIDENAVLIISYIGYQTQEVSVAGKSVLNITMISDSQLLDEVVVVGYGTQRKENLTGAITQISSETLESRPISNVSRGLQGLIPNLNITNKGGNPNENADLNIRGITSINGGGPLVLVDGIQMNINQLNPLDIESITVLKDAASAAIYGARGAFGVILVTLKNGAKAETKPIISYSGDMEFSKSTYLPDMLKTLDYMTAHNLANQRRFGSTIYSEDQLKWARDYVQDPVNNPVYHIQPNGAIFWHANVDNFSEMLQPWAPAHNHALSVQGNNDKFNYYASLGYRQQEGLLRDGTDVLDRYNFLVKMSTQLTNWFRLGFSSNYTNRTFDQPHRYTGKGSSWWEQMTRGAPQILFPIKTPSDSPLPNEPTEHFYNFLTAGGRSVNNSSISVYSIDSEIDLFEGLKLRGDFSYRNFASKNKDTRVEFGYIRDRWNYQYGHTVPSYVERVSTSENYFAANAYLTYDKSFGSKHMINALLGFNQEWNEWENFSVQGNNLISNEIPVVRLSTGEQITNDNENEWAIRGVFMRFKYNYKHKYLFEMNGRYDGTSRFPKDRRFGFFPSFSAGWRISEERFMEGTRAFLDDLKLRASYGSLGNQLLSNNYPYINTFGVINQVQYLIDGALPLGLTPPGLVSTDLTWETATTIDFGVDLTLFGKLDLSADWYKRITRDMLVAGDKLPAVLGAGVPNRNSAELETIGGEFSIAWRENLTTDLNYNIGVVVSDYQSTITKFDGNPNKLHTAHYEGKKFGEIWGYETVGIFQSQADIEQAADHSKIAGVVRTPGDIEYADINGDGVIDIGDNTVGDPGDKRIIGNSTPRFQFGVTGSVNWKILDLRVFFQGIGSRDIFPTGNFYWGHINSGGAIGTYTMLNNTWSEENSGAHFPIYKVNSVYNIQTQTRFLENSAYMRFKNLTVGVRLPSLATSKLGIEKTRLYFSGENIMEFSKLRGKFDPEVVNSEEGQAGRFGQIYPLQRTYSLGLQISF